MTSEITWLWKWREVMIRASEWTDMFTYPAVLSGSCYWVKLTASKRCVEWPNAYLKDRLVGVQQCSAYRRALKMIQIGNPSSPPPFRPINISDILMRLRLPLIETFKSGANFQWRLKKDVVLVGYLRVSFIYLPAKWQWHHSWRNLYNQLFWREHLLNLSRWPEDIAYLKEIELILLNILTIGIMIIIQYRLSLNKLFLFEEILFTLIAVVHIISKAPSLFWWTAQVYLPNTGVMRKVRKLVALFQLI